MLKIIRCNKFTQKEIIFHKGLNAVVGDEIASNSIGKTTLLMIIDFVFGGNDYITKNSDTVENLGHHEFQFTFEFDKTEFYFSRKTDEYDKVFICDFKFNKVDVKSVNEYCSWLQKKYNCILEDLSFRNIIGRYFRIYGKENLNERKPIQYFEKEKSIESILALIKLFDKFKNLREAEVQLSNLKDEKSILLNAGKKSIISTAQNKVAYKANVKQIEELTSQLENLKKEIVNQTTDIGSLISEEILSLQKEKSDLSIKRNSLNSRLQRTQINIRNKKSKIHAELGRFKDFFPDFNIERAEEVDGFHENITQILKHELGQAEKTLLDQISKLDEEIHNINIRIESTMKIKSTPKFSVDHLINLSAKINELNEENKYFSKKENLIASIRSVNDDYETLKIQVTDDICSQINSSMEEINKSIYSDGRRAPHLNIHGNSFTFNTYGDTGTGTAFASLISFDLSLLHLTCLPALIHDLPLLKNIENIALENILELYSKEYKQVFIAIDKLSSYGVESSKLIKNNTVLQLDKNKLLFIKNWKNK